MNDASKALLEVAAAIKHGGPFNDHAVSQWQAALVKTLERRARELEAAVTPALASIFEVGKAAEETNEDD